MRIIFEGPDNVGKSTLIRGIIKELKIPFLCLHSYAPPSSLNGKDVENFHTDLYKSMFKVMEDNKFVISDRFYPGSYVYSKLYNRGISGDFVLDLEYEESKKDYFDDVCMIILLDSPENLVIREDGLSIMTGIDIKKKEVSLYKEIFEKISIKKKALVNVENKSEKEVLNEVIRKLRDFYE